MPESNAIMNKLKEYSGYLVAVYFLFPILWVSYIIGIWLFFCLIDMIMKRRLINQKNLIKSLLLSIPFWAIIVSVFIHPGNGEHFIERGMGFALFPISIFLSQIKLNSSQLIKLTWVLLIGSLLLALKGLLLYVFVDSFYQYDQQHDFIFRYRSEFNQHTQIPPTYASIYFAFASIMVFLQLKQMTWGKVLAIAMVIILLLNMILLSAKMPIIAFGLIMLFLLIRKNIFLGMMNKKRWLIAGSIITLLILGMFIFTRWGELFTGLTYRNIEQQENSVGIRKGITQCGLQLSKEHFLAGIGPQNVQQALNQCYYQFEGDDFSRHSFNTHNQYLDSLISHGILGLILLLIMIIYPIVQAIRLKDPILLSFTLLIALCMLTENILSRQAGVVFYAFFNSILLNQAYSQKSRQS